MAGAPTPIDGRHARRERNVAAALDATVAMFREATLVPSIEAVSKRTGLSVRSLYRYFADGDALIAAAIERSLADGRRLASIEHLGDGPFDDRVRALVHNRVALYEVQAPQYRATVHHAPSVPQLHAAMQLSRRWLRQQTEQQFASELRALGRTERRLAALACDTVTQFPSIEFLRVERGCSVHDTEAVLRRTIAGALGGI